MGIHEILLYGRSNGALSSFMDRANLSMRLKNLTSVATTAGNVIGNPHYSVSDLPDYDPSLAQSCETDDVVKDTEDLGHHAIHTPEDFVSQRIILQGLDKMEGWDSSLKQKSWFLTEEGKYAGKDEQYGFRPLPDDIKSKILTDGTFPLHAREPMYVIDPLDGTAQRAAKSHIWSVSIGRMEEGEHVGGAVYCPWVGGGFLVFGEKGRWVYSFEGVLEQVGNEFQCIEHDTGFRACLSLAEHVNIGDARVHVGVDTLLPKFSQYVAPIQKIARRARVTQTSPSCAYGLAELAAGKADLFIAQPQKHWDYAAGMSFVEELGGKVVWNVRYERVGDLQLLDNVDPAKHYAPDSRIGFIAGRPNLVDSAVEIFMDKYVPNTPIC